MILTVTLNAALDVTYEVPALVPHSSHRVSSVRTRGGGKGANVARVLAALGEDVMATGLAGGRAGEEIVADLEAAGVPCEFAPISGESRRAVTVVSAGDATVFNEPGPEVGSAEWAGFLPHFGRLAAGARVVVLSGSLPPGLPADAYSHLVRLAREAGARVILDAGGTALRLSLSAGPDVVKPNVEELRAAVRVESLGAAVSGALAAGAGALVVSRGPDGLLAVAPEGEWSAVPPEVVQGNPTGAGDAAAAALARGLRDRTPWKSVLADAVALSAAAVLTPQAGEVDLAAYRRFLEVAVSRQLTRP